MIVSVSVVVVVDDLVVVVVEYVSSDGTADLLRLLLRGGIVLYFISGCSRLVVVVSVKDMRVDINY